MDNSFSELEYQETLFKSNDYRNTIIKSMEFTECKFIKCNFREAQLTQSKFQHCMFADCDFGLSIFKNCSFSAVTFKKCQLVGINWTDTSLARKNFIKPVDFIECVLNHSTFMGLSLKKLQMEHCMAHDVDFSETDLSQADCRCTDFSGSRFFHTNLSAADFTGAINYSISVIDNPVKKAKFSLPEAMSLLSGLDIELNNNEEIG